MQLDALRELANIGSGTAGTALSSMIGRSIDVSVPTAQALPVPEAVEAAGPADEQATGVVIPVMGSFDGIVLMLFAPDDAATLCGLLGVEPDTEVGLSALGEIGNILGTSYINALGTMTGQELEPCPPEVVTDMLGAIVSSVLTPTAEWADVALVLDSDLRVEGEACSLAFMLVPSPGGVAGILAGLGLDA
jgi:chemotaxis protein CheC